MCSCPDLIQGTVNGSESNLKLLVILVIVNLVLSVVKIGYYKASSTVERKDLHTKLEEMKSQSMD
jgi:hypothetical protein